MRVRVVKDGVDVTEDTEYEVIDWAGNIPVVIDNGGDKQELYPYEYEWVDEAEETGVKIKATRRRCDVTKGKEYTVIKWEDELPVILDDANEEHTMELAWFEWVKGTTEKPNHYSSSNGKDVWESVGGFFSAESRRDHHRLNAVEYILRCMDKGGVEDLKKAKVNLDKAIEVMESSETKT